MKHTWANSIQVLSMKNATESTVIGCKSPLPCRVEQLRANARRAVYVIALIVVGLMTERAATADQLWAGVGRVDITNVEAGPVNDPLYVKALVIKNDTTTAAIITVDAVAIAEIGTIRNEYLATVRAQIEQELKIPPAHILINASHCHGQCARTSTSGRCRL